MNSREAHPAEPASILFVHNGQNWITGSERCLLDLLARLNRSQFRPVLLCNADAIAAEAEALGVPVHRSTGWRDSGTRLLPNRTLVREARDVVRQHGVRLIHANDQDPVKSLVPVARAEHIPLVAHLHLVSDAEERRWSWVHQASLAVGVSEAAIRGLCDDGVPPTRRTVIYNGIDPDRLARGEARGLRRELGIDPDDLVIATVGSLITRKGIDVVLTAFVTLRARHPECHLLLLGDGPEREALERQASNSGVRDRVHFLGRRTDVGAILRDAVDVVVTAARDEALGLNVLEAGLLGIPVVASALDAHREVVIDGETGMLVPVDDAVALAGALEILARDPDRRARYGESARSRVVDRFLVDRYVRDFEILYSQLLSRPRSEFGWLAGTRWPPVYTEWVKTALKRRVPWLH